MTIYGGLMSGTSLDGVDGVLAEFPPEAGRLLAHAHLPYPDGLRRELAALNHPGDDELARAAAAALAASDLYAKCVAALLESAGLRPEQVSAVGCHGQTVRHQPGIGYTIQLLNAARVAETTRVSVVCDFRSRDVAAGGQGAPLVPAYHRAAFARSGETRCIVNLGGIANLTVLHADGRVEGFDTGPGNGLLDAWCQRHQGRPFDADGAWAATGNALAQLLETLLADPYFDRPPPKSTGREDFNRSWLERVLTGSERPADVQATLVQLTARSIADAVTRAAPDASRIFLCGGGARNGTLRAALEARLAGRHVGTTDELGVPAEQVEAAAFAWLAARCVAGLPGNVPAVTGARGERVLGAIYPA
ncbi:MAG: anhydro-N-acetylmuramic acid kinase [Pseudomonadota bacterium]